MLFPCKLWDFHVYDGVAEYWSSRESSLRVGFPEYRRAKGHYLIDVSDGFTDYEWLHTLIFHPTGWSTGEFDDGRESARLHVRDGGWPGQTNQGNQGGHRAARQTSRIIRGAGHRTAEGQRPPSIVRRCLFDRSTFENFKVSPIVQKFSWYTSENVYFVTLFLYTSALNFPEELCENLLKNSRKFLIKNENCGYLEKCGALSSWWIIVHTFCNWSMLNAVW